MQMATLRWLDEYSNQGIVTTDTSLRIQTWNHWLQKHTGRRAEDVVGQPLFDVFPEIVERGFERYYRGALDGAIGVLAQPFHRYLIEISVKMDEYRCADAAKLPDRAADRRRPDRRDDHGD